MSCAGAPAVGPAGSRSAGRVAARRSRPAGGDGRDGAVLIVVVLLTLAMLALAHGLLVSAESAYVTSRAHARVMELEALAAGAIEAELRRGWAPWMDSVAIGAVRDRPLAQTGARTVVSWRRLGHEVWIVGASSSRNGGPSVGSRRLVWIHDPATRVGALPAVVSTAADAPVTALGAIVPDTALVLTVVDEPALGLLDVARLLAAADSVGATGTPTPVEQGGACATAAPWNWGDPERSYRPCGAFFAARGSVGALTLEGGTGQGVFVVEGDLVVRGSATLFGLVIATGRVDVVDGSSIEGRVIAHGGIFVGGDATVVGSVAWAERALAETRATLGVAVLLHGAQTLGPE